MDINIINLFNKTKNNSDIELSSTIYSKSNDINHLYMFLCSLIFEYKRFIKNSLRNNNCNKCCGTTFLHSKFGYSVSECKNSIKCTFCINGIKNINIDTAIKQIKIKYDNCILDIEKDLIQCSYHNMYLNEKIFNVYNIIIDCKETLENITIKITDLKLDGKIKTKDILQFNNLVKQINDLIK